MMSHVDFLGYSLAVNPFPVTINREKKIVINTINQNAFCVAEQDVLFKKALQSSDILLPDGMAVVKACKYLTGQKLKKVAGSDMHDYLLSMLNERNGKCFYLGSTQDTLDKIKIRLKNDYPSIKADFYSPPYKSNFDENDITEMINSVNNFTPDVVFIGLTAPKQEKLANEIKDKLRASIICSIGAVFDFYAGTINRPSQFWINLDLEWFIRLVKEPKRMWKRYIYYGFVFGYYMGLAKCKGSFSDEKYLLMRE